MLTEDQIAHYQEQGYLLLKGAINESDIARLERGVDRNPPLDGTLGELTKYPAPGRYTLATQCLKDPDLAFLAEHPTVVSGAADLLDDQPILTAYVIYDRTPGGPGIPAHHDYKRWRPVGSSMNWLFTIVPFCDFNAQTGQLFIAPGSHQLERVTRGATNALEVQPPSHPADTSFIDPGLERGDLLFMNMYLWHRAAPNLSDRHRVGAFNKYAAASAPPATGYFLYDDDVYTALSEQGRSVIAAHSDKPILTTRSVLMRESAGQPEILLCEADGRLSLPGGPISTERAIPDWDLGNYIASLQQHLRSQLAIELPWMSYIGDFPETDHLCRVYGYTLNNHGFPVPFKGRWVNQQALQAEGFGYEADALSRWLDPGIVRGKGLAQAQCRIDQYAY